MNRGSLRRKRVKEALHVNPLPLNFIMQEQISHLFPIPTFKYAFTTSEQLKLPAIEHVELSDDALGVHRVSSKTSHHLVIPPNPSHTPAEHEPPPNKAWEAVYPEGSINPTAPIPGGFSFYLSGPKAFAEHLASNAKEVTFSYRMMLEPGWEWAKGGKFPGICGGVGDYAYGCTGGRQDHRCQCFDLRPMWRANSEGELYTYLPLTELNSTHLLAVPPLSKSNSDYGISVGRGSFHFDAAVGRWLTIAFRIKLNDPGAHNGQLEMWVEGRSVMSVEDICVCESQEGRIKGMHFQTFFGGHTKDWASPKEQRAFIADISGAVVG